jgi:hypothetical protein
MSDDLFTNTEAFLSVVAQLRSMAPPYRSLALYGADHWTDAEFMDRLFRADVPAEPAPAKPNLKLVQ